MRMGHNSTIYYRVQSFSAEVIGDKYAWRACAGFLFLVIIYLFVTRSHYVALVAWELAV